MTFHTNHCIFYVFSTVLSLSLTQASAQGPEPSRVERWSISKIVARAMEHAPEFRALDKDIEKAENLARQAGRWENPEGAVSYGPMMQSGLSGHALSASLMQNIPLFGQKAIARAVGDQAQLTVEAETKHQRLLLQHEVVKLTYRLAALEEESKHVSHRRENINLIAGFLKTRPFASPAQAVEKYLVLNRLRDVEERALEISSTRENTWQALNVFLAVESRVFPNVQWNDAPVLPTREALWKLFQIQNPELQRHKSLIVVSQLQAEQAAKKAFPEVRIGGGYSEQTADLPQHIYVGTLEFSLPIFDRGGYAKQAALAGKEAATHRLEQKKRELQTQFDQTWTVLERNKKRIDLYPLSLVRDLEAQMTKAEQNWKKGLLQVTAFLELENQVHDQAHKIYDAQADYAAALSQIQLLAGIPFDTEDK